MPHSVATLKNGSPSIAVRVVCDESVCGVHMSRTCAQVLTTHHIHEIEQPLATTIGDTPYDCAGQSEGGVPCMGLLCGRQHTEEALRRSGARSNVRTCP